ncbi:hypothetical protein F53441_11688 [Fusarium austroafricanum]|uniref:Apple domain-containing protein n=1 Tax=Fusarium austroafricanum TaxID=2364996 RepID=A0A8H4K2Z3_9HYPO|nr:hypothetical protein F53441_11688 [Fusarium austroafricanum]
MKTSFALLSASMASAMPSPFSTQKCNTAPSASANSKIRAYHTSKADTAMDCQTFCASDNICKSFAFGLVKGAPHPSCLLFKVSAAQVPARKDGLHIFDKDCASKHVPTSAPTTAEPWGTVPKNLLVRKSLKCNCAASGSANADVESFKTTTAATAKDCQALAKADTSCQSFLFGLPDGSETPVCKLYKVAAAKIPARGDTLFIFDKGCSSNQVPTTTPTEDASRGLVSTDSKVTKVEKAQPKETKDAKDTQVKQKENKEAYKVSNPKPKTTKIQKSIPKVTKVAKVEINYEAKKTEAKKTETKDTKSKDTESKNTGAKNKEAKAKVTEDKDVKIDSPKTLATKVRNNNHQATQAANTEGKKSACKTTKGSVAQPKITQA